MTVLFNARRSGLALAAATLLAFAVATPATAFDPKAPTPDLSAVTLTIGIQNSGSTVVRKLLDASGVFDGTPYKISWAEFDGADGAVEALNAGAIDLDVGLNFSAPVLGQANSPHPWTASDRPYVVIGANLQIDRAGTAIVVHPNSGIKAVSDLAGKSVSFAKGTANHYFLALAAKKAGIDISKIIPVLMPLTEARAAFIGGSVDGLVTAVSNARPLITSGDGQILTTSSGLYDNYAWFVARPEVLADAAKEAATADVLVRLQRANLWQAQHLDQAETIYENDGHQQPADAKANAAAAVSTFVPIDAKVIASNQDQANVFLAAGVAATKVDAAIEFDDRFNAVIAANPGPADPNKVAAGKAL